MNRPRVRFTEEMSGAIGFGARRYTDGYDHGVASRTDCMFRLTIIIDDVSQFMADPMHLARAEGEVRCQALSDEPLRVEEGTFNLFAEGVAPGRASMRYRLWFRDLAGSPLTLLGRKDVGDDLGWDVWRDTTTLATALLDGHVEEPVGLFDGDEPPTPPAARARGLLMISAPAFARQLLTFRGTPGGIARFGAMFAGNLWRLYRGPARPRERVHT